MAAGLSPVPIFGNEFPAYGGYRDDDPSSDRQLQEPPMPDPMTEATIALPADPVLREAIEAAAFRELVYILRRGT